jgi:ribosome-associated toxin RatA of RatAB toxin-antitoxin module
MTVRVTKQSEMPYSCAQMYALVNDVERYADFLPYCTHTTIHYRHDDEVQATVTIAAMGMSKSYTTRNLLQQDKMIEIRLVEGPFKHLEGFWRFDPTEQGCTIQFDLEFEFSNRMMSMVIGPVFEEVSRQVFDAFCARAHEVYGDQRIVSV